MSQDESCQDRQNNELEVLKAIFGEELRDLRKNKNKKKWQPLDICLTLTPQRGMSGPAEVFAQVDLHVICGEKYPQEVPKIELQNGKGISYQKLATHLTELENLAIQLKGEVMIYELCQHVQKFLHDYNKPGYSSFYEEMVLKQQERIKSELEEKQMKEDKERQVLQDEILKRKEALKAEMRNRRESARLSIDTDPIMSQSIPSSPHERVRTYSRRRCTSTSESSESSLCEHRGTKLLHFDNNKGDRQVLRGKCLGHSTKGSIVYAGNDMITGELLAITEWTLKCEVSADYSNGETSNIQHSMKQIASIEQELNHLCRMHHPNLVQYLNMKYVQDHNIILIYILQEFVVGTTCSFFLSENIPADINMLRHLAIGILTALQYLHENNVVHKDLRDSSIHIDRTGLVKLSDYSLDKRLSDMHQTSNYAKVEHDFPTIQGRGGKKTDIYRFGVLILSLLRGSIISDKEIEVEASLQPDLRDFIAKCLLSNERSRWSAEQLLEHCFLKTPMDRGISPPKLNGNQEQNRVEPEQEPDADIPFLLPSLGGQSRIQNEFQVLKWLGKGAFGDVLKVRNKLDGGIYAIKRIELNPKNKQLNRKITREVKLLSRLNHENVVRYYNSWIESATLDDTTRHSKFTPSATPSIQLASLTNDRPPSVEDKLGHTNIEKLAPPMHDVEWNVSYESRASVVMSADSEEDNSDHSEDESDSDEEWAFIMRTKMDSSDSIEFERDGASQTSDSAQNSQDQNLERNKNETEENEKTVKEIQFMYIQMEFCEKSTLRTAIDNGLHEDEERIWRLFREIVEGLTHIHQQGMIHRDLKPVNIFLDSNDHVKIGDFGLATTNILSSLTQTLELEKESQMNEKGISYDMDDLGSLTGQVGTALYVAPELSAQAAKAIYNQKVDIYSLGIIFFEMCYKPLTTGMERVKVLLNLRSKEIILPSELVEMQMSSKVYILRWLLNHDPSQRPTSQELLASEYLPPPQLEEAELQEMVRHTLSNAQSKAYKYLVGCCFSQEVTPAEDITYDMSLPARGSTNSLLPKFRFFHEGVKAKVIEIFQRHGGVCVSTPLLMPKSGPLYSLTDTCVRLMTRTGSVVSLPHDLRAPFARYVAWNNISNIRRYSIERVYREKKVHGFHPRELYECAFDIVSSMSNNLMAEAELLSIAWEICNELPQLQERNFTVRINHTSLLQAVLMYCGIEPEKYQDIYTILNDTRDGKFSRFQLQTHLISLCLTDQAMETLFNLFETESSVAKIASVLKTIARRKGDAAALAKEGLREIEIAIANAEALGVKWPITVAPLLVHNIQQYSGIIYQITCEIKRRRRRGGQDVIAAGGRYDKMLSSFRQILERTGMASKEMKQYGVGISISLDKLVCAASESSEDLCHDDSFGIDVAVCCVDGLPRREKELADVLRELWSLGLRITSLDISNFEEILEYCRENHINHVVVLKSGEKGSLRIESWERDRFQERKISIQDVVEYFQRQTESVTPIALNRSESKLSANLADLSISSSTPVNVNINFVHTDKDKLSGSARRSYKNSMLAQMSSYLQRISPKVPIEVFAVFLDMTVVRTITNFMEIDEDDQDFQKSVQLVIEKHPRHKKYVKQICDEMWEARNDKSRPVLILYSLPDSRYVTLELLHLFKTIVNAKKNSSYSEGIPITSIQCLESSLCSEPALSSELIDDLLQAWPATSFFPNSTVQDVYLRALKSLAKQENIHKYLCVILCILSKLRVTENKEEELLCWLNKLLLETCDPEVVELAFYSRSDEKFMKAWHKLLDDRYFRTLPVDSDGAAKKICNVIFPSHANSLNQAPFQARELSLRVIKRGVHWLQDILDVCSNLTANEDYDSIQSILSSPVLRNLWPSLLLHFLHNLPDIKISTEHQSLQLNMSACKSLKFLLNSCHSIQSESNQPIFLHLYSHLMSQLHIIEWILDFSEKCPSLVLDQNLSFKRILKEIQDCCILTILKKSVDIHECDHTEIEGLLKNALDDINVFRSYRAMHKTLRAILLREKTIGQPANTGVNDYNEVEWLINTITPLQLRVEVIENIFSMLFLRYDVHFNSIIERTSEEESYETTLSEREKQSSAYESKESEGTKRHGYVNDENTVKNLLVRLKRCMAQVAIDFAKLRRKTENTSDFETIQKKIFSMDKVLSDAVWRLELLTSKDLVENHENIEENLSLCTDTATDQKLNFSFRLMTKAIFYQQRAESSSSDCDQKTKLETDVSSETSSTDVNSASNRRKKRKNSKNCSGTVVDSSSIINTNSKIIINLMLASNESLVYQCLWKADYSRAQQVIEMFNLKNTPLDAQVQFSQAMQNFRREVSKQMNSLDVVDSSKKNEMLQILENVRRAASGGYHNSRLANSLETFVASQESVLRSSGLTEDQVREQLCLCALDLALTLSAQNISSSNSSSLLEVAAKHSDRILKGPQYKRHLEHLERVSKLVNEVGLPASEALIDAKFPLQSRDRNEKIELWGLLADLLDEFRASQSFLPLEEDSEEARIKEGSGLAGQKSLLEMARLCGEHENAFLHKLIAHLQLLKTIAPSGENNGNGVESLLLCDPIDFYLGQQIFDLNVEPKNLEATANKLGVNLVHNILINCCPKLTCYNTLRNVPSDTWGCIVLNKQPNEAVDLENKIQDPNQCVADILLELLQTMKRLYPDCSRICNKDLADLSKENEIQSILAKSVALEYLDLSELSVGEHTLAFFLNLWNLLFLHALLNVWINDPPVNSLKSVISLSAISYRVGDLGRISLTTLRSKLLGNISWNSDFFLPSEDLNEVAWQDLDLIHDPRVIFAMMNEYYETPAVK
ncbi:hypothetical protein QAD02_004987, partial [Eretmocerus hayati]